jgi:lysozyme
MKRSLELYKDGWVLETKEDQPTNLVNTQGQISQLLKVLKSTQATTFTLSSNPSHPTLDIPEPRGRRQINPNGLKLLTSFEGCELTAYDDGVGVWTIGYGHTRTVRPGMTITQAKAEALLQEDLAEFEAAVASAVSVALTDNQFSALVCFCYNVGAGADGFGGSTLLKLLNTGDYKGAASQFNRWNKAGGQPLLGLTRRRKAEQALFLDQPWQPFLNFQEVTLSVLKLTDPFTTGDAVHQLQTALKKAGLAIEPDGVFGKNTDKAIKQFQQQKGLVADGIAGAETQRMLGLYP